jgi:hypothetical protein
MRSDMVPGAIFPDYELSDHTAKRRKLSDLQGQHPMVARPQHSPYSLTSPLKLYSAFIADDARGAPFRQLSVCYTSGTLPGVWVLAMPLAGVVR